MAFWLQKPSILRACVREEDAGGSEAGVPLDLKMQLENGRAEERVSRGQASNRAVCVCESVSVEMGARRPPLPTAVVCPPGRRRRRHLAITAVCLLRLLRLLVKNERDLFEDPINRSLVSMWSEFSDDFAVFDKHGPAQLL